MTVKAARADQRLEKIIAKESFTPEQVYNIDKTVFC